MTPITPRECLHRIARRNRGCVKEAFNKALLLPVLGLQELLQLEIRSPFSQTLHFLEENLAQRVWRDCSSEKGLETRNGCINKQTVFFLCFICNRAAAVGSALLQ